MPKLRTAGATEEPLLELETLTDALAAKNALLESWPLDSQPSAPNPTYAKPEPLNPEPSEKPQSKLHTVKARSLRWTLQLKLYNPLMVVSMFFSVIPI